MKDQENNEDNNDNSNSSDNKLPVRAITISGYLMTSPTWMS